LLLPEAVLTEAVEEVLKDVTDVKETSSDKNWLP
jgi:hypothetical protein